MTNKPDPRRGQALLLVTFALIAMCGLLGLAVDLGWSYFVKKSAQASADAAALSAVHYALSQVGQTQGFPSTKWSSGGNACPSGNVNTNGCAYALNQGFAGSASTTSGANSAPPTVPNLATPYWVTARAVEVIPQLFSAVLGNPTGISSARATAAVVTEYVNGALHTLNRQNDYILASGLAKGVDIGGSGRIIVPSGLMISSQSANAGSGPTVTGPITIVSPGNASALGASPITDIGDSGTFLDPYRGVPVGQPALPSVAANAGINGTGILPTYGVPNGNLVSGNVYLMAGNMLGSAFNSPFTSGNYVPIACSPSCAPGSTAAVDVAQLTLSQSATFSDPTATCYQSSGSTFGCFFFYGGLSVSPGRTMTMGAGEFVMVGGGPSGMDFVLPSSAFLDSQVSCQSPSNCTTAGVVLVMTGSSSPITCGGSGCSNANGDLYLNLGYQINTNPLLVSAATATSMLNFGSVSILSGADSSGAAPTGLVAKNLPSNLPASSTNSLANTLAPFDGVVLWQDQANSTIEYTSGGYINTATCAGTIDNPCTKTLPVFGSEGMTLQANSGTGIQGIVYQPRGAYLQTGGGTIQGPIQIITGAISMQGGGTINLTNPLTANQMPPTSAKRRVVTLVE